MIDLLFSFQGRIGRLHYLLGLLVVLISIVGLQFGFYFSGLSSDYSTNPLNVFESKWQKILFLIVIGWAIFSLNTKRLHDFNYSGLWQLIPGIIIYFFPKWFFFHISSVNILFNPGALLAIFLFSMAIFWPGNKLPNEYD